MYDLLISFVGQLFVALSLLLKHFAIWQPFDLELLKYSQYCYSDIASVEGLNTYQLTRALVLPTSLVHCVEPSAHLCKMS